MTARACILGCFGPELTPHEKAFFKDADPWGFILFKRNIDTPEQVGALTASLRETVGRADAPILIDQEGGRVQRMGPPHWRRYPPARAYGSAVPHNPHMRRELTRLGARLIAHDLLTVGINVDCAPVLDVPVPGAHDIIGDRAYAEDAWTVATLGRAAAEGLLAGGVLPVVKHMPGHGRAGADSHEALPIVTASRPELEESDFEPFRALAAMPLGMTAHVVYTALDEDHPATTSPTVIREIIRGSIGFSGLLMSDDLSMKALSGSLRARAEAALAAGCDVALHCNGRMEEMQAVAAAAPLLAASARERADAALARVRRAPEPFDPVDAEARLTAALAAVA